MRALMNGCYDYPVTFSIWHHLQCSPCFPPKTLLWWTFKYSVLPCNLFIFPIPFYRGCHYEGYYYYQFFMKFVSVSWTPSTMVSVTEIAPPTSHGTMKVGKNSSVIFKGHLRFGADLQFCNICLIFQIKKLCQVGKNIGE